ncbi:MAG: hypothetical protein COA95_04975 [Methylophaga sp.]|nr:MAG: hypothetical protein COA95_04975 [Methylophaga sp.]
MARWSYILYKEKIYWCIEWDPSLIVLEIQQNGVLQAVSMRDPRPSFGGRVPLQADLEFQVDYEDYENHQYNLIFNAWDSQYEEQERKWMKFESVKDNSLEKLHFNKCISHIDNLAPKIEEFYQQDPEHFINKCKNRIEKWAGKGKRVLLKHKTPPLW